MLQKPNETLWLPEVIFYFTQKTLKCVVLTGRQNCQNLKAVESTFKIFNSYSHENARNLHWNVLSCPQSPAFPMCTERFCASIQMLQTKAHISYFKVTIQTAYMQFTLPVVIISINKVLPFGNVCLCTGHHMDSETYWRENCENYTTPS